MSETEKALLIEGRSLEKRFPGAEGPIPVLRDVDFTLRAGETVSISGESGSGKSTLLHLLSGLERPEAGILRWGGKTVSGCSLSALAAKRRGFIGFVFQAYYLAPELNTLENVLLGARIARKVDREAKERAHELLERVGLGHRLRHPSTKLSGGERQRVAVARALVNDPPIVLADEPTGNLDERTGRAVMDLLLELADEAGKSLVLVTHNAGFAARAARHCELHLGRLA